MRIVRMLFLVLLAIPLLAAQFTREDWSRADEAIVRLKPDAFPNLPEQVRTELTQGGCRVPQPREDAAGSGAEKKNVVSGHFTSAATTDWAVLCSHEKRSSIFIFRGGRSTRVDRIGERPDSQYLQVVSEGKMIGYSRVLSVATVKQVRKHFAHADHEGILDSFTGKASLLWYRSGGKWMKVPAGD